MYSELGYMFVLEYSILAGEGIKMIKLIRFSEYTKESLRYNITKFPEQTPSLPVSFYFSTLPTALFKAWFRNFVDRRAEKHP